MSEHPGAARLDAAVVLTGPALHDAAVMLRAGVAYRRAHGALVPARVVALVDLVTTTAGDRRASPPAEAPGTAWHPGLVDTATAAAVAGLSTRHLRRKAGPWGAVRHRGRWWWDLDTLAAETSP